MSAEETPVLDELTERIRQISGLLASPEPGLLSWKFMLANKMKDLCEWWTEDDPK